MSASTAQGPSGRTIVRQLQWIGGSQLASQFAWYAVYLVLATILAPSAFGTVAASLAIVGAAQLIMESGTGGSLVAARQLRRSDLVRALAQNLGIGLILTVLIAAAAGPLTRLVAEGGDADVMRVLGVTVTIGALSVVPLALLKKAMRFREIAVAFGIATLSTAAVAIVAALLGAGVWALVARQLVLAGVSALIFWLLARDLVGRVETLGVNPDAGERPRNQLSFLVVQGSLFLALTLDNLVVGSATDARQLGLYALAFALAFAPLTQLAWVLGQVLFPAAAATADLEQVGRRTVHAVRASALFLLPFVPPVIVLAAPVIPALLGPEWEGAVLPFQALLVVGVGHALLNPIGESLAGCGGIALRARFDAAWAVLTLGGVYVGAQLGGIDGAAIAHGLALVVIVGLYGAIGIRRIGSSPVALWHGIRDVAVAVAGQAVVTALVSTAMGDDLPAAIAASVAGLVTGLAVLWLTPSSPLREGAAFLRVARRRRSAATG